MRKYQQLFLVVVALFSMVSLFVYRTENNRLQYVLDIMNFFGQNERIHKEDVSFEYTSPYPIWQRIGNGFHAYSAFWHNGTSEITTIAVGMKHSQVSFKCEAEIVGNSSDLVPGKFGFLREEMKNNAVPVGKAAEEFVIYKFICKLKRDVGRPKKIFFTDVTTAARHSIGVRDLDGHNSTHRQQLVACVDMASQTTDDVRRFYGTEWNLLEYFFHHQVLGVDEFIVYDNTDLMNLFVKKELALQRISVNLLPFNFPFETQAPGDHIRRIVNMDCELRTLNMSRYFITSQPNEFMYSNSFLNADNSTLHAINESTSARFAISTNLVCFNSSETRTYKMMNENEVIAAKQDLKTPSLVSSDPFLLYRPNEFPVQVAPEKFPGNRLFVNRYVECVPMDRNDESTHTKWPTTIEHSISHKFFEFLESVVVEVAKMKMRDRAK